jgi:hypothetical protein
MPDDQLRAPCVKRLTQAPNIAIASLWADLLNQAGITANVQRFFASSIAGEIPPDQAMPEVWILDEDQFAQARQLLDDLRQAPQRRWVCRSCQELVEGAFEQCWNCGAAMDG